MATPTATVVETLESFGSVIERFSQTERIAMLGERANSLTVGICRGMCLDWARKVLQHPTKQQAFANPKTAIDQTTRQAVVHTESGVANRTFNKIGDAQNQLIRLRNPALKQVKFMIPRDIAEKLQPYVQFTLAADNMYTVEETKAWMTRLEKLKDQHDYTTSVGWAPLAGSLDSSSKSARPFSALTIVNAAPNQAFGGGGTATEALKSLVFNDAAKFRENTVIVLGFEFENARSQGHDVAIYMKPGRTYHFFDPNFGVFGYDVRGLGKALLYLFASQQAPPIYGEDGIKITGKVEHVIFGLAGTSDSSAAVAAAR